MNSSSLRRLPPVLLVLLVYTTVAAPTSAAADANTLAAGEQSAGWKLLFDGKTPAGWVAIGKDKFPAAGWVVEAGALVRNGKGGGDIVTAESFDNFELMWEWKVGKVGGNSGLKYNLPNPKKGVGFEYQMMGDAAKRTGEKHETASLYDLLPPDKTTKVNPPGEWNVSRVIVDGNHVEHWRNGAKALGFEMGGEPLTAAIARSKFKSTEGFGQKTKSPILLQDHGDEVAVRSIKIRVIESKK
jgi:hypothetical protein